MCNRGASRQHDATDNNCGAAGGTPTPLLHQLRVGQISDCFKAWFRRSRGSGGVEEHPDRLNANQISQGSGSSEAIAHPRPRNSTFTDWTGYLTKDNLYTTIDTTKGERVLLAIALNPPPASSVNRQGVRAGGWASVPE